MLKFKKLVAGYYRAKNQFNITEYELMTVSVLLNQIENGYGYDELKQWVLDMELKPNTWIGFNVAGDMDQAHTANTLKDMKTTIIDIQNNV